MDVLPLVPVGSLVLVVAWLIWPVFEDSLSNFASSREQDRESDDVATELFDTWAAQEDEPGLATRKHAA